MSPVCTAEGIVTPRDPVVAWFSVDARNAIAKANPFRARDNGAMDLVEFLRARLAEGERAATRCGYVRRTWDGPYAMDDQCISDVDHDGEHGPWRMLKPAPPQTNRQMTDLERQRALAEVEVERKILNMHEPRPWPAQLGKGIDCVACREPVGRGNGCRHLRLRALPYADHPDYDEKWRI